MPIAPSLSYYTMYYSIEVITPPESEPVSVDELKLYLRSNNGNVEDDFLAECITTARTIFETYTMRCCQPTELRQHVENLNLKTYLMRSPVTEITAFEYYDSDGVLQEITQYYQDDFSSPSSIWVTTLPATSYYLSPVAYVDFTAGWTDTPKPVITAIKLLAAHYYRQRQPFSEIKLNELPLGFAAICDQYRTGTVGDWKTNQGYNRWYYPTGHLTNWWC